MTMDEHNRFSERTEDQPAPGSVSMADFDEGKYLPYLDGIDLDARQKAEFLALVWNIMRRWVEMDWPLDRCGQILEGIIEMNQSDEAEIE